MQDKIYVVGHKNPDTDSICAAIAFARLKERLGVKNVVPCRAGKINRETQFVLDYFGVKEPMYLADVKLRVKDMLNGPVATVKLGTPLHEVWKMMKDSDLKTVPVIDQDERMIGMITIGDLSRGYIENMVENFKDLHILTKNVIEALNGKLLVGSEDQELKGDVFVGAMSCDAFKKYVKQGSIVLVGNRESAQKCAINVGVSALILTGNATLSPELEKMAKEKNIVVISVPMDSYTASRLLPMSVPVQSIMREEGIISFHGEDLISEVKQKMLDTRYRNYPVLDDQGRVVGLISRYHLLSLSRKKVILVDHNEFGQSVSGAEQAQILEVIDHHRVGGIQTGEPILFRNEPVGSTCTIVAKCYRDFGIEPEKEIAGLMLGAILSDTVIFKSPTCTETDKEIAKYLGTIAGVDPKEFGIQMFKASSNLADRKIDDLIEEDLKEFTMGDQKFGIGQVSLMGTEGLEQIRNDLMERLDSKRKERNYDNMLLMVTDLLEENTELFVTGSKPEEIAKAFDKPLENGSVFLPKVLSRKKQVIPPLTKHFVG